MRQFLFPAILLLAGCQDAHLTIAITDAPVDEAEAVSIQFTGVELERSNGKVEAFDFSAPRDIDLLALQGGTRLVLLDGQSLDPNDYRALRLKIRADGNAGNSFVRLSDGSEPTLKLASADADRLRVSRSFSIGRGDELSFTIDFDLRKSVRIPAEGAVEPYRLVPALRLVQDDDAGTLSGTVAAERIVAGCTPAVYVYAGSGVTPNDVGSATEPLNSARVLFADGSYRYTVGLLPAGSYTTAFTCAAADDAPDADEGIAFAASRNVAITAGRTTSSNF